MTSRTTTTAARIAVLGALGIGSLRMGVPIRTQHSASVAAPGAVMTAHAFLAAVQQNDLHRAYRLVSPRLHALTSPGAIPLLLGVQNTPQRTVVLDARDEDGSTGPATMVEIELRVASGFVDDGLTIVRSGAGYAVDDILTADPTTTRPTSGALTTARTFLVAFRRADRAVMSGLMSPRLRRANGAQSVSQMLGVRNIPQRIDILDAGSDRDTTGPFTDVGILLVFARGMANADLQMSGTPAGYRVDAITHPVVAPAAPVPGPRTIALDTHAAPGSADPCTAPLPADRVLPVRSGVQTATTLRGGGYTVGLNQFGPQGLRREVQALGVTPPPGDAVATWTFALPGGTQGQGYVGLAHVFRQGATQRVCLRGVGYRLTGHAAVDARTPAIAVRLDGTIDATRARVDLRVGGVPYAVYGHPLVRQECRVSRSGVLTC